MAASLDYEINLKAEVEIMALHDKLDRIRLEHFEECFVTWRNASRSQTSSCERRLRSRFQVELPRQPHSAIATAAPFRRPHGAPTAVYGGSDREATSEASLDLWSDDVPKLLEQRLRTLDNAIHRGLRLLLPKDGQLHLLDEDVRGTSSVVESRQWDPRSA